MQNAISDRIDFRTIKASVSMQQVLDHYGLLGQLRRSGDNLSGACPIHRGHNKTQFRVSLTKNCWHCFGDCQAGGSVLDFVSYMEHVSLGEAAELVQQWFDVQLEVGVRPAVPVSEKPEPPPVNHPLGFTLSGLDPMHPHLTDRDLSQETIMTFGLGYCATGTMAGRIVIPIHNAAGQLVAYAGRWPGNPPEDRPKYQLPRGFRKSLEVFNYHRIITSEPRNLLVLVEGFFGCIKVWQAGFHRVVSIMGSTLSEAQEELIVMAVGPAGMVILMFDEDGAGRTGREKAAIQLARKVHIDTIEIGEEGIQPDHLPEQELIGLIADAANVLDGRNNPRIKPETS